MTLDEEEIENNISFHLDDKEIRYLKTKGVCMLLISFSLVLMSIVLLFFGNMNSGNRDYPFFLYGNLTLIIISIYLIIQGIKFIRLENSSDLLDRLLNLHRSMGLFWIMCLLLGLGTILLGIILF